MKNKILKDFLNWYYNLNKYRISKSEIKNEFKENYKEVIKVISPYFRLSGKSYKLDYKYDLGPIYLNKHEAVFKSVFLDTLYLDFKNIKNALNKDLVLIKKHKKDYIVDLVIKHNLTSFVSEVKVTNNEIYFIDSPFNQTIILDDKDYQIIKDKDVLYLKIDLIEEHYIYVSIKDKIGSNDDPNIELYKLIYKHDWPLKISKKVENLADKINFDLNEDYIDRVDLTSLLSFTIDGVDAKDLDDALSLKINDDNTYTIYVHIADVSYFVKEGSLIDKEAYQKTTSVYLNDYVIPMLPKRLSNDLCSLNPNTNKYTITCEMTLDYHANLLSYEIYPSIINSKYRLNYDEVNDLLINNVSLNNKLLDEILLTLNNLSLKLSNQKEKEGKINFNSTELNFIKDQNNIIGITKRETYLAEELIENFMILANEVVSGHLTDLGVPLIYRVHEMPDLKKFEYAIKDINKMGYNFHLNHRDTNKTFNNILNSKMPKEHLEIANMFILRSLKKARYDTKDLGHYGLKLKHYSHFTAPIRRYSDLILHRIIRESFKGKSLNKFKLNVQSEHLSENEVKALSLERDVIKLNSILYLKNSPNKIYDGYIISFLSHGFFVKLENNLEVFVSFDTINKPYIYDFKTFSLKIRKYKTLNLGSKVKVKLLNVNLNELKIDFILVDDKL